MNHKKTDSTSGATSPLPATALLESLLDGEPCIVLVYGDAGRGKSWLLNHHLSESIIWGRHISDRNISPTAAQWVASIEAHINNTPSSFLAIDSNPPIAETHLAAATQICLAEGRSIVIATSTTTLFYVLQGVARSHNAPIRGISLRGWDLELNSPTGVLI